LPHPEQRGAFKNGASSQLLNDYTALWAGADCTVFNLECPLTNGQSRIRKIGPHLKASPECIAFFKHAPTRLVCLANNHIRDYGDQGVLDTLHSCHAAGLPTVGAGRNLEEARTPFRLSVKGLRLGIVAMAEREFNIAGAEVAGANPIDFRNFTLLKELRQQTDFLLILLHAGTEMFQYPRRAWWISAVSWWNRAQMPVVVQHTHCVGCHELYAAPPLSTDRGTSSSLRKPRRTIKRIRTGLRACWLNCRSDRAGLVGFASIPTSSREA